MRILIVDDNEEGRYLLESLLQGLGHETASAGNGAEAIERLHACDFDIIVTDILMPVMDGFQLCMQVKQSSRLRGIPLVFYTATYVDEHDENLAMMMGAHRFVRKPIEPAEFIGIINETVSELTEGKLRPRKQPLEAPGILLERYNERVVSKLQKKMQDLEQEIAQRKKAEAELRDAQHLLNTRDEIAGIFLTLPDETMYGAVLEVILEALESKYGIFGYIDDEARFVCPSMTREVWDRCQVPSKDVVFHREQWGGLWGKALIEKRILFSNEGLSVPLGHIPIGRAAAVPIIYRDEVIGGFVVANKETDYIEKDLVLLRTLADYVAPVLQSRLIRGREEKERRQAEAALKESEERYRIVADFTHDWDYWVGTAGVIVYMSPSCERITGYSRREFMDDPELLKRIVHPADRDALLSHFSEAEENSQFAPTSFDFKIIRKDGTERWINHACQGVLGYAGEPRGRRVSNRDITDRKRAEGSLRKSEQRNRLLIEESPVAIGIFGQGGLAFANPMFLDIFGYQSPDEVLGRLPEDFVAAHDKELVGRRYEDLLARKRSPTHYEVKGRRKNGDVFDLAVWPRHVDYFGEPAVLEFLADRTERRTLRAQLFQAQKMEAVAALAGGIAHDFNNLLQIILGYCDLLLMGLPEEDRFCRPLREMAHAARSGAELVRGLLTFSRKVETHFRPVNLNQCVERVNKLLLRTIFKTTKVEILLDDNLATINADPTQMEQVLMNLAVNARDAMADAGTLTIETKNLELDDDYCRLHLDARPGDHILLTFSDTGQGMDQETLEHIFDPFFTTKGPGRGTGLGLAIVYGIVKQHGGHVTCNSEPGKGTTFSIYLPVIAQMAEPSDQSEKSMPPGGSETLLLVDDEEPVRRLGQRLLTRFGYRVLVAASGQEALDLYRRQGPEISLVILDLVMPKMGGKQCLEKLLEINPAVKVLISSGYSANDRASGAAEVRAKGFIGKPYDARKLLQAVREVLDAQGSSSK